MRVFLRLPGDELQIPTTVDVEQPSICICDLPECVKTWFLVRKVTRAHYVAVVKVETGKVKPVTDTPHPVSYSVSGITRRSRGIHACHFVIREQPVKEHSSRVGTRGQAL